MENLKDRKCGQGIKVKQLNKLLGPWGWGLALEHGEDQHRGGESSGAMWPRNSLPYLVTTQD